MPIVRDLEADYPQKISSRVATIHHAYKRYYHGDEKYHLMHIIIDGIIRQYINKSVDKAFSVVCDKFSSGWDGFDYKDSFWSKFNIGKYDRMWYNRVDYYIDDHKIIRKRKKEPKDRSIYVGGHTEHRMALRVRNCNWDCAYDQIKEILEPYFKQRGWNRYTTFTIEEYNNLVNSMTDWYSRHPEKCLYIDGSWSYQLHGYAKRPMTANMFRDRLINAFEKIETTVDMERIKPNTKEWFDIKVKAHKEQHNKQKAYKQRLQERSDKADYILWRYKTTRLKKIDSDADVINRDRHGFDENSFKGEFYHGQKRKKRLTDARGNG